MMEPRLHIWCPECGKDLNLTSSGHYFCVNRRCKDGFDVTAKGLKKLLNLIFRLKDKKH